jgi:predicted transcriptional regulator
MSRLAAVLSVSDLAKMANVSRQRMHRVLATANVPTLRVGMKHLIYLVDLKRCAPDLWLSITEYQNLKS